MAEGNAEGIRSYGPGKFSTIVDSYVYDVSLQSGCDEEEGSVSDNGTWYGIMRNGRSIFKDHDPMLETLNDAEQELLTSSAGLIISENDQGFVYVEYFDDAAKMEAKWAEITKELSAYAEQDEEEEA